MNYLLLAGGVLCALVAFACFVFCILCWINSGDDTESQAKFRRRVIAGMSVGFLAASYVGWRIYSYLVLTDPGVFEVFVLWYMGGLASRLLILVKRHEVLSLQFATDWDEVQALFFWALLGPFVTIHLVKVLFWEKNWFDE